MAFSKLRLALNKFNDVTGRHTAKRVNREHSICPSSPKMLSNLQNIFSMLSKLEI